MSIAAVFICAVIAALIAGGLHLVEGPGFANGSTTIATGVVLFVIMCIAGALTH